MMEEMQHLGRRSDFDETLQSGEGRESVELYGNFTAKLLHVCLGLFESVKSL